jgi:DNA ligase 4
MSCLNKTTPCDVFVDVVLLRPVVWLLFHAGFQHLPEEYNTKGKLEVLVAKLGGSVVQNNLPGTRVLIASSRAKLRVQTQIAAGTKDIMKPEWLIACLDEERLVEPEPRYCIFMCEATRKAMEFVVDKYGDHFTRHTTPEELKAVFSLVRLIGLGNPPQSVRFCSQTSPYWW